MNDEIELKKINLLIEIRDLLKDLLYEKKGELF